jgi:hypothetical protein
MADDKPKDSEQRREQKPESTKDQDSKRQHPSRDAETHPDVAIHHRKKSKN